MKKEMTGYPSIDRPWNNYYKEKHDEESIVIPEKKTIWDVIEESLYKHIDTPAIEYFGGNISRRELIDNVYMWTSIFERLGVRADDTVAYYGPFLPETSYMMFALNVLGACPYFLKLAINEKDLAEEAKECKIAVVFDQMWDVVSCEFSKEKYEAVITVSVADSMPFLKKTIYSIATFTKKKKIEGRRILSVSDAKKMAKGYSSSLKAPFEPNRNAFITSSSGTTVDGVVKGVVATNEAAIAQIMMAIASGCQYFKSERCLNNFPPTAATSLNILFLLPLYRGMTIVMDPRVSEDVFFNQVTKYKVSVICATGSTWEAFFNRLSDEINKGKDYDFSHAKAWVVGGEGTDVKKFKRWQEIMAKEKSKTGIASAYGCSELFSAVSSECTNARYDFSKPIMSVGIPFTGMTVGVFDGEGRELGYNQRGELRIKSKSAMKEYYNKPELTAATKEGEWIKTGDLAEIDENGFLYIWGRANDACLISDGQEIYLFDIETIIKEKEYIEDAVVLNRNIDNKCCLIAHVVFDKSISAEQKCQFMHEITEAVKNGFPSISMHTYAIHEDMLPYSPTTLKKDRNRMMNQNDNLYTIKENEIKQMKIVNTDKGLSAVIIN